MISALLALAVQIPHFSFGPPGMDFHPLSQEFPGRVQTPCYPPTPTLAGRTWISKYDSAPNPGPGYFWVSSDRKDPEGFCREGELVFIERWDGNRGYFREGMEILTAFDGHVKMVNVDGLVTKNVSLKGGSGTIHMALVDGGYIEDWTVPTGWDLPRAISLQGCRNIALRHIKVGASGNNGPGEGYAVQSQRSAGVHVSALSVDGVRHGLTVFSGGSIFLGNFKATNPKGTQVDSHGYGARLFSVVDADCGGSDIAIGNRAKWGDEAELWMVRNAKVLWLHGPSRAKVYYSTFDGPLGFTRNGYGEPLSFYGYRTTFTAFSSTQPVHYEGSGPWTIVPTLEECVLKAVVQSV